VWAKFNRQGKLLAYQLPQISEEPTLPNDLETQDDMSDEEQELQMRLRQEMLDNAQRESSTP
jgi:hypothetical protein